MIVLFAPAAAGCVFAAALALGDMSAIAWVSAAILTPFMVYGATQCVLWRRQYAFFAAVALLILLCSTFRIREITDKSIDLQIVLRLGALAGMAAMSLVAFGAGALRMPNAALKLWAVFALYSVFTSLYSLMPATSFIETASGLIGFLFLLSMHRLFGADGLTRVMIWSITALCALSLLAYAAYPSLGRMLDWVNGAFVPTARLTGVFGTSNAAGASAGFGVLLTILLSGLSWRKPWFFVVIAPMLVCLVLSNNRMAIFAVLVALLYAYVVKGSSQLKILGLILLAGFGALAMTLFGDTILTGLSRSGSADEITSGTGRTRIWAVVLDLWSQQPIFGYGEGSARLILPVHPLLFKAAAHAHSLYFNALFSGGIISLGLLLAGMTACLKKAISERSHAMIALLIFEIIYGLTEPTIGGLIAYPSLSFYAVMVLIGAFGSEVSVRPLIPQAFWPRPVNDEPRLAEA